MYLVTARSCRRGRSVDSTLKCRWQLHFMVSISPAVSVAMRCKIAIDGPWHDGWTWRHMVATLLASFVAVRCWPSSPFVIGQRTSARDTLVSRRAGNPFDVLGLPRSASYDEIRSAFRSLARSSSCIKEISKCGFGSVVCGYTWLNHNRPRSRCYDMIVLVPIACRC